jgi:transketolase
MTTEQRKEQMRKYNRVYHQEHKEQLKEYRKQWYKNHPEYFREYNKKWHKEHPEQSKESKRKYIRKLHDRVIDFLGGKCVSCGITDKRVLQINHINNDGTEEIKKIGTRPFYFAILQNKRPINDLDVRCANCNILYRWKDKKR